MELMIRTELFEEPQICGSRTGYDHIAFSLDWTLLRLIYLRQIFFVRLPSKIEENMNFDYMHFEMANLSKRKFKKLPANITISAKGNARHGPRIKIQNNYGEDIQPEHMFAMTVPDGKIIGDAGDLSAADLKYFEKFVSTNMKILFEYWNNGQNMDTLEVIESLIF